MGKYLFLILLAGCAAKKDYSASGFRPAPNALMIPKGTLKCTGYTVEEPDADFDWCVSKEEMKEKFGSNHFVE